MPRPGEHPLGDKGQIFLLIVFMLVWVLDSFFLKFSIILAAHVPLYCSPWMDGGICGPWIYLHDGRSQSA